MEINISNKHLVNAEVYTHITAERANLLGLGLSQGKPVILGWATDKTIEFDPNSGQCRLHPVVILIDGTTILLGDIHNLNHTIDFTIDPNQPGSLYVRYSQSYTANNQPPKLFFDKNATDHDCIIADYDPATKKWKLHKTLFEGNIAINADTLDGLDSTQFLRSDVDDVAHGKITFENGIDVHKVAKFQGKGLGLHYNTNLDSPSILVDNGDIVGVRGVYFAERSNKSTHIGINFPTKDTPQSFNDFCGFQGLSDRQPYWIPDLGQSIRYKIWHEGNDGSGSGLDADKLDGLDAKQFARTDQDTTINANYYFAKDSFPTLTHDGVITIGSKSSNNMSIGASDIQTRNNGQAGTLHLNRFGNEVYIWTNKEAKNKSPIRVGSELFKVWHEGNDGSGSGLDADQLDGHHANEFFQLDPHAKPSSWTPKPELHKVGGFTIDRDFGVDTYVAINNTGPRACHLFIDGDVYANGGLNQLAYNDLTNVSDDTCEPRFRRYLSNFYKWDVVQYTLNKPSSYSFTLPDKFTFAYAVIYVLGATSDAGDGAWYDCGVYIGNTLAMRERMCTPNNPDGWAGVSFLFPVRLSNNKVTVKSGIQNHSIGIYEIICYILMPNI